MKLSKLRDGEIGSWKCCSFACCIAAWPSTC